MIFLCETQSLGWTDIITSITAVAAIVTALISILFTRNIAKNSVKPLLSTISISRKERCEIRLKNYGNGPAIITKIEFYKKGEKKKYNSLYKAFPITKEFWEGYYSFSKDEYYLSPGESIYLGKIELEHLKDKAKSYKELKKLFDDNKNNVVTYIEYKDVFGNKMKPYHRNKTKPNG